VNNYSVQMFTHILPHKNAWNGNVHTCTYDTSSATAFLPFGLVSHSHSIVEHQLVSVSAHRGSEDLHVGPLCVNFCIPTQRM